MRFAASDTRVQDHSISDFGGFNAFCTKTTWEQGCSVRNVHICVLIPYEQGLTECLGLISFFNNWGSDTEDIKKKFFLK